MTPRLRLASGVWLVLMLALTLAGCASRQARGSGPDEMAGDPSRQSGTESQEQYQPRGSLQETDRAMSEDRMSGGTSMSEADSLKVFLRQDVRFAYDSFTLSDDAKAILAQKAQYMTENHDVTVQIEGHCDERGTMAYNLALGERRAYAVKQYMDALGIGASRMTTISYGEEFPLDPRHNESAWAQNRRAHFAIFQP